MYVISLDSEEKDKSIPGINVCMHVFHRPFFDSSITFPLDTESLF